RILLVAAAIVAGCAHAPAPTAQQPEAEEARHGIKGAKEPIALPHRVVDGDSGDELADRNLDDKLRAAKVIYVGEEHPNPHHHAVEIEVLERAYAADPSVGLGLEMLPRTYQGSLDAYVGGTLDEAGFLAAVAWDKTWGYAWGLYKPLLEFCRAHKLPAYALNAPRELAHAVAKNGIDGLSAADKAELPEMKPGPEKHREMVREAFAEHPHAKFDEAKFERFYAAQLVWDETMAERVAAALKAAGAPARLVVVAGEGTRAASRCRSGRRGAGRRRI
ncbi:MAG TPA: ChaN family lipoprotein, partial [Polyangia bacterium]|nr:ChaN family lipoprotein [Polyangia bacterium]